MSAFNYKEVKSADLYCPQCGVPQTAEVKHYPNCPVAEGNVSPIGSFLDFLEANEGSIDSRIGVKHDAGKLRMDLLDSYAMYQLAAVLTYGAKKYSANNWRKGIASSRLLAASLRHIFAYMRGEDVDNESQLPHLAHAMCNLMFAINLAKMRPELSNHFKPQPTPTVPASGTSSRSAVREDITRSKS